MKLDAGQAIAPVPCPIQSRPKASARKPTVKSNLRMGLFSRTLARLSCNGDQSDALAYPGQEQGRRFRGQQGQVSPGTKKAPDDAGAFVSLNLRRRFSTCPPPGHPS